MDFSDYKTYLFKPVGNLESYIGRGIRKLAVNYKEVDTAWASLRYAGVEIEFNWETEPEEIGYLYFYVDGEENSDSEQIAPFVGTLPLNIERGASKAELIDRFGQPDLIGGDLEDPRFGYQRPWIKYYIEDGVQLMIELNDKQGIWRLSIGRAIHQKS